eukprot:bmy_07794T0
MNLKSRLWQHHGLGPTTLPKSPSSFPDRSVPACLLASAQGQSLIRPCGAAPLPGAWFLEHSPVPPPARPVFPAPPSPAHPVTPVTRGSFPGPHLNSIFPGLCSWPQKSTSASVSRAHAFQAVSSHRPLTSLLFTFLMTHGAQGYRASEGPRPRPQPLGRCPCSAMEAPASPVPGAWPRGHQPSPREERVVPSFPTGASTPSHGPVGEGGGREDADKIKGETLCFRPWETGFKRKNSKSPTSSYKGWQGQPQLEDQCEALLGSSKYDGGHLRADLPFCRGNSADITIVDDWLSLVKIKFREDPGCCIAVHCVAGLGRAPVLVALALIEGGMKYEDAVQFIRQKRRGAFNSKQLLYLEKYRPKMRLRFKDSNGHRNNCCVQ